MFVCRKVRKKSGSVGCFPPLFFFFVLVFESFLLSKSKNIQVLTFMLSIYSCLPMFSMFLRRKRNKQNKNSTGAKNNGSVGRLLLFFFLFIYLFIYLFFWEIEKTKQKLAGFLRVGRVTANKQFFFYALVDFYFVLIFIWIGLGLGLEEVHQGIRRCCCNEMPPTTGQNLDFVCTRTSGKSAKFFTRKLCQVCAVWIQQVHYNKRMLITQDCVKFHGRIA